MAPRKKQQNKPVPTEAKPATLQRQLPGITATDYKHGINAYMDELGPRTALEKALAADIAAVSVEYDQLRARKHMLMWQKAVQPMFDLLTRKASVDAQQSETLALTWAQGCSDASAKIVSLGVDPEVAHNEAFVANIYLFEMIEKQIERLERRRRNLLADYRQHQKDARRPRIHDETQIEDAVVMDAQTVGERVDDEVST